MHGPDVDWDGVVDRALQAGRVAADTRERQALVKALRRYESLALLLATSAVDEPGLAEDFNAVLQALAHD
jgi:hypothetical protein